MTPLVRNLKKVPFLEPQRGQIRHFGISQPRLRIGGPKEAWMEGHLCNTARALAAIPDGGLGSPVRCQDMEMGTPMRDEKGASVLRMVAHCSFRLLTGATWFRTADQSLLVIWRLPFYSSACSVKLFSTSSHPAMFDLHQGSGKLEKASSVLPRETDIRRSAVGRPFITLPRILSSQPHCSCKRTCSFPSSRLAYQEPGTSRHGTGS